VGGAPFLRHMANGARDIGMSYFQAEDDRSRLWLVSGQLSRKGCVRLLCGIAFAPRRS
jgi:hypothetical protein